MAQKASVLVVANRTAESPELLSALRARHQEGPVEFTLLVPATPQGVSRYPFVTWWARASA